MRYTFLLELCLLLRGAMKEVACRVSVATALRIILVSIAYNTVPSGLVEEETLV